jgi:predicted negative regulator of RcsB-dependent stress response
MVEDYLSDREQEEALRNWWRENWRWVISGVFLGLAALGGWQYWQQRVQAKAEDAARTYTELGSALAANDKDKVEMLIKSLDQQHSDSPYVDQAHLALAQSKVSAGEFEQAATELKVVADKAKDPVLAQVAKLRLARVQLQLGHPDEALALLGVDKAGAFESQIQELRGDALLAKGDRSGARIAYQAAVNAAAVDAPTQSSAQEGELLHLKLQDLADTEAAPAAK